MLEMCMRVYSFIFSRDTRAFAGSLGKEAWEKGLQISVLSFEHNEEKWLSSVLLLKVTTLTNICRYESTAESDSLT